MMDNTDQTPIVEKCDHCGRVKLDQTDPDFIPFMLVEVGQGWLLLCQTCFDMGPFVDYDPQWVLDSF